MQNHKELVIFYFISDGKYARCSTSTKRNDEKCKLRQNGLNERSNDGNEILVRLHE
jgi:hypothetical protein